MAKLMESRPPREWLPKWWEYRRLFGRTPAAAPLVDRYEKQRAAQRAAGQNLYHRARGVRDSDRDRYFELLEQILTEAPASYYAYHAWKGLSEKKPMERSDRKRAERSDRKKAERSDQEQRNRENE